MHPIKDYYLTGDLHSAALVAKNSSVEWLCFPNFDSPSIFASMLDEQGGYFKVEMPEYSVKSNYIENTAIVEFRFSNKNKNFLVHDFMVPQAVSECNNHYFVRKLIGGKGKNKVKLVFNPKPDYARRGADFQVTGSTLRIPVEHNELVLHLPKDVKTQNVNDGFEIETELGEKEEKIFAMEFIVGNSNSTYKGQDLEKTTKTFWDNWIAKGRFFDFHKHQLIRSMITLKMMQFYPTGAIIAAPTTSLPAQIGGIRNWDYRYVWIRDATFTLYAFHITDYTEEAESFFKFIQNIAKRHKKKEYEISTAYSIWGDQAPSEITLKFNGYENSQPVRIGNNATNEFQLDTFGTIIDAHYFMAKNQKDSIILDRESIIALVEKIKNRWKEKDSGIWEIRNHEYHYTYSKVMCWVGIDRAIRMSGDLDLSEEEVEALKNLRSEIKEWIWENCYNSVKKNFTQYSGSEDIDASNFLFVLVQFLNKNKELTKTIIENTKNQLCKNKIFVYRYLIDDGLKGHDSSFVLCIFWLISALAITGEIESASGIFETFGKYISETNLISEQIDPESGEYLGNYPQAFSHLGFVMAAYYLNRYGDKDRLLGGTSGI